MCNLVACVNPSAVKLIDAFWPGPLTIILPKKKIVPTNLSAGLNTVGVRSPNHMLFREVLSQVKTPLAAPSANRSNAVSPTTAQHVLRNFDKNCPPVLDGGTCIHGLESTVLDLTCKTPTILRPGPISKRQIEECLKIEFVESLTHSTSKAESLSKSPGTSKKHYAPKTPVILKDCFDEILKENINSESDLIICMNSKEEKILSGCGFSTLKLSDDNDPITIGKNLYHVMQIADTMKKNNIYIHKMIDSSDLSKAINDRLSKASSE